MRANRTENARPESLEKGVNTAMPAHDEAQARIGVAEVLSVEWTREGVRVLVKTEARAGSLSPCELIFPDLEALARLCELLVRVGIVRFQSGQQRKAPQQLDQLNER